MKLFNTEPSDSFWIKWENSIFPDEKIPIDEWERDYIDKIDRPVPYWESPRHRAEFLEWAKNKQADM